MQLAKNLYTVCGYAYSSQDNVYAIQAPHGVILVDTGTDDREYDIVQENLAYWGLGPVTHVTVSYTHLDVYKRKGPCRQGSGAAFPGRSVPGEP